MSQIDAKLSSRKRPKQTRSTQLVNDVLEAATLVLSKEDVRCFTTSRVAQAAGVSVGSVYQYFPNKDAILFRLQTDEWQATIATIMSILTDKRLTPLDRLRSAIAAFLRSECDEAPLRQALAPSAPSFKDMDAIFHYRRAAARRFLTYWREVLPGLPRKQRLAVIELVMITVEAVGARATANGSSHDEAEAYAQAASDMVCAYLNQLNREAVTGPDHSSVVGG